MTGRKAPRKRHLALALGALAVATMLAMFYGQYRWLTKVVINDSALAHENRLREHFERDATSEMKLLAKDFGTAVDLTDDGSILQGLNRTLARNESLLSVRFMRPDSTILESGDFPVVDIRDAITWLPDSLIVTYPVADGSQGQLSGVFALDELRTEAALFLDEIEATEVERKQAGFVWMGVGTLVALVGSAIAIWLMSREQSRRIHDLIQRAIRFGDTDFGEPLPEGRDDELSELAAIFNTMRDRLRSTTLSRDYVDSVLSSMNDAIIVTTNNGVIKRINKATTHLLGYDEHELIDTSIDFVVNTAKSGSLVDGLPSGLPKEAFFESKFGESIPVSFTCSVLEGDEAESGDRIYAAQNITERRRAEQRIRYLARIDALTKIPNRMQFQHLLQRAIARGRRNRRSLAMIYIDIDHFKEINDTFGHLAGDTTLETVADRLTECLPEHSVIGRLAGDEFAGIVDGANPDASGREQTDALATHLLARLADPFFVQGHEVFMTASMGIAFYPSDASNVIDLIRNADAALYHSKKNGGNVHSYYLPEMNEAGVERLMTKSKLKRAFERDELLVHYQPKYNLETGEVFGAEALVRWELPERGIILPSDFIPIAEETNLIIEIGEWVLDKVCEDFRYWQRSVSSPGRVSVNLSLKQLRQRNFTQRISSIMRSYEVSPTSLELEITETTLMENTERTIQLLDQLYALGLHLAIDDFGTGYSSLSALQQFPISTLKIDKSFVRHVATNPDDATLVRTIVLMGQNLNMDVVAEGVETEEQLAFLQSTGCTYAQGLLFGDPMSSDNYLELLLAQVEGTDEHRALFA